MSEKMKDDHKITFIRGATTASGNSVREIEDEVVELIDQLITRNNLIKYFGYTSLKSTYFMKK